MLYRVVLVFAVKLHKSAVCVCVCVCPLPLEPPTAFLLLKVVMEWCSLCYIAASH